MSRLRDKTPSGTWRARRARFASSIDAGVESGTATMFARTLKAKTFVVTILIVGVVGAVGVVGVTRGHAAPRLAPQSKVEEGKTLFADNCARCHVDGDAPSLDGLFKGKALPSGAAATDENVRNKILHGGDIMPGYEDKLTSAQIDALIAYLHTL